MFGGNVILKGQMIRSRLRLADLTRKVNIFNVRKITEVIVGLGNAANDMKKKKGQKKTVLLKSIYAS